LRRKRLLLARRQLRHCRFEHADGFIELRLRGSGRARRLSDRIEPSPVNAHRQLGHDASAHGAPPPHVANAIREDAVEQGPLSTARDA
jgi:hypothetical protein